MRRPAVALVVVLAAACVDVVRQPSTGPSSSSTSALPPLAERAYGVVSRSLDEQDALQIVQFMQQYWRLAGNPGFDASIDEISRRLSTSGFSVRRNTAASDPYQRVDEYPTTSPGWDHARATLSLVGDPEPVLAHERDRVALAINSFSTPEGGIVAKLIDVGNATAADFAGKDVRGALVLGDASLGVLWREAVRSRGAAGIISTEIASYIRPADPAALSEAQKDVLQWGSIPYDDRLKAFGFKASWRSARRLREALATQTDARVAVDIRSTFHTRPARMLMAEIPGSARPHERIVLVAHVQEPGANDNASGCATLYVLARALNQAIARGELQRPDRTLTFLWLDEIRGSRQWLSTHGATSVRYMFSMDMTGQDVAKTGGSFLIEKQADPTAVWARPSDPHSEWGAGTVKVDTLKGSLLNDVHLAVARRRSRDTGWIVRTNPYEGGSDHTVFAQAGVPSLLNWHFTDRYYHTNQDTFDKVSGPEMKNVGVTVATTAYLLAAASEADALATVDLVERAAIERLELEQRQGAAIVARAAEPQAAARIEAEVNAAWIKWYVEALDSVQTLAAVPPSARLLARIAEAKARFSSRSRLESQRWPNRS